MLTRKCDCDIFFQVKQQTCCLRLPCKLDLHADSTEDVRVAALSDRVSFPIL